MGFIPLPGPTFVATTKVHPVVVFNICDSFIRRQEGAERVIGTLIGTIGSDGVVEVKNSYTVPHNENGGQVYVDVEFHRTMFELHQRVNPKEVIVGWYSTGDGIIPTDTLIHEFYAREAANPLHLTLDVNFVEGSDMLRCWVGSSLTLGSGEDKGPTAMHFQEVNVESRFMEAERVGIDLLKTPVSEIIPTEIEGLESTVEKLGGMLDQALEYVTSVCEGKTAPDSHVGRYLADTLSAVPRLTREQFEKLFGDGIQDVLLVMYLSNLTKMQLGIAEKLQTASLPI